MTYVKDHALFFDFKNYSFTTDYKKLYQKINDIINKFSVGQLIDDIPVVFQRNHIPIFDFITEPIKAEKLYDFIDKTQGWDDTEMVIIYYTSTKSLTDFFKDVLQKFATRYNIDKIVVTDKEQLQTILDDVISNNPKSALSLNELIAQELIEDARIEEIEAQKTITLEDLEQEGKVKYAEDTGNTTKKERLLILLEYLQDQINSLRKEIKELN